MVATTPAPWAVAPGAIDPAWQFLWRDMCLAIPFWRTDGAPQELIERINLGSDTETGAFAPTLEGLGYNNNGNSGYLTTTRSHQEYSLTRNGAWTFFWAMRFDGLSVNSTPIQFHHGSAYLDGHWGLDFLRSSGQFVRVRFQFGGSPGDFSTQWTLGSAIPAGYHTFCFSMPEDRGSLRFYLDGVDQGVAGVNDTSDSYQQPTSNTELRFGWPSSNRLDNYAFFIARDTFITEAQAAALHNDPWTWVRPAPIVPAIFGGLGGPSNITGTAAATIGAAVVAASGVHGVSGTVAASPGAPQVQGAGTANNVVTGTVAASIGPASASGTGAHGVSGLGAMTTGAATAEGRGAIRISGVAAAVTAAARVSGSGTLTPDGGGNRRSAIGSVGVSSRNSPFI